MLSAFFGIVLFVVFVDGLSSTVVGIRGGDRLFGFNERISIFACERTFLLVYVFIVFWRRFRYVVCACFVLFVIDRFGRAIVDGDVGLNCLNLKLFAVNRLRIWGVCCVYIYKFIMEVFIN